MIATARRPQRHLYVRYDTWRSMSRYLQAQGRSPSWVQQGKATWMNAWFSAACSMNAWHQAQPSTLADPVFVCGYWRSGTTLLHELLSTDPAFRSPRTDECMNPALLLAPTRAFSRTLRRPMDSVQIRADSPQEDEFALLALGLNSFYAAMLLPSTWRSRLAALDPETWTANQKADWMRGYRGFLSLLDCRTARPLLKSPTHTFRMDWLAHEFPRAQFVIILREPRTTYLSGLRLWRTLFDLYALESFSDAELPQLVRATYELMSQRVVHASLGLSPTQLVTVRYEDLVANPLSTVRALYRHFRWTWNASIESVMQMRLEQMSGYAPARYPHGDATPYSLRQAFGELERSLQRFFLGADTNGVEPRVGLTPAVSQS
jgi:hypothetical protein